MSSFIPIRPSRRLSVSAVAVGLIAAVLVAVNAFGSAPAVATVSQRPKPTIVLVHGAWADASGWDGVIAKLQRAGYNVIAPADPLRSLYGDSAYIASILAQTPGPIVLVGHSYGGAVITNAAASDPNVKALVYIDAFIPNVGENVLHLTGAGSLVPTALEPKKYPPFGKNDIDVYLSPTKFHAVFAGDLPAAQAAVMAAAQRPLALIAGEQPTRVASWKKIPSWDLIGLDDKVITPSEQLFMAHRAHAHIVEIDSSHVSLISHPQAVTNLIERAATATG
jgi:pimeloyl-ACP methyl ester carboxylesterase